MLTEPLPTVEFSKHFCETIFRKNNQVSFFHAPSTRSYFFSNFTLPHVTFVKRNFELVFLRAVKSLSVTFLQHSDFIVANSAFSLEHGAFVRQWLAAKSVDSESV